MNRLPSSILFASFACATILPCFAVDPDDPFTYWPTDLRIGGTIIACSPGEIDPEIPIAFLASAGGNEAKIVVVDLRSEWDAELTQSFLGDIEPVATIFAVSEETPPAPDTSLATATGILLLSTSPLGDVARAWLKDLAPDLEATIHSGAAVCAVGPVAALLGSRSIGNDAGAGLSLIPDTFIDVDFGGDADRASLLGALGTNPLCVGIGIPSDTAIVLKGRKIRAFGKGDVTFLLAGNGTQPERIETISPNAARGANPYQTIADLTAWRRDAIERQLPRFPAEVPPVPDVENGTLIIVGGGGMPRGLMERMVELAGGEQAKMIYVPCTEADEVNPNSGPIRQWQAMGVESALVLHTKDREKANSDETFLAPLNEATGIWFGGGRQWNLADSYFGTRVQVLMHSVLERGGVIGGSSAGASIQADYLARANPVANFDIMAAGYERGLGFIQGVAIDQHFSQRGRQKDMRQLVERYPQVLGIGIDEATALVVKRSRAEIVGRGKVYFYDRRRETAPGETDYRAFGEGVVFDLAEREVNRGEPSE